MRHSCGKGSDGRIFWSDEEYDKVLKNYHNMLVKGTVPRKSEDAMREAQKVLPRDRWRNFKYSAQAAPLLRRYRQMIKDKVITNLPASLASKAESRRAKKPSDVTKPGPVTIIKPPAPPTPAPSPIDTVELMPGVRIPKDIYEASVKHHLSINPVQEPSLDAAFKHILNKVVDERLRGVDERFAEKLVAQEAAIFKRFDELIMQGNKNIQEAFVGMQDSMRTMIRESHVAVLRVLDPQFALPDDKPAQSTAVVHVPESTTVVPPAKRKPKILIAGGEKRLGESIKQRFPEMEIIQYDQQGLNNRELNGHFDLVIGSRWLGHSMQHRLKNSYGDKYEFVDGAISSISDRIQERVGQFLH